MYLLKDVFREVTDKRGHFVLYLKTPNRITTRINYNFFFFVISNAPGSYDQLYVIFCNIKNVIDKFFKVELTLL